MASQKFNLREFIYQTYQAEMTKTSMAVNLAYRAQYKWYTFDDIKGGRSDQWNQLTQNVPDFKNSLQKMEKQNETREERFRSRYGVPEGEQNNVNFIRKAHQNFVGIDPRFGLYHLSIGPYQASPIHWKIIQKMAKEDGIGEDDISIRGYIQKILNEEIELRSKDRSMTDRIQKIKAGIVPPEEITEEEQDIMRKLKFKEIKPLKRSDIVTYLKEEIGEIAKDKVFVKRILNIIEGKVPEDQVTEDEKNLVNDIKLSKYKLKKYEMKKYLKEFASRPVAHWGKADTAHAKNFGMDNENDDEDGEGVDDSKGGKSKKPKEHVLWRAANNVLKDMDNTFSFFMFRRQLADPSKVLSSARTYLATKLPEFLGLFDTENQLGTEDLQLELDQDEFNPAGEKAKGKNPKNPDGTGKKGRPPSPKILIDNLDPNGSEIAKLTNKKGEPVQILGRASRLSVNAKGLSKILNIFRENKQSPFKLEILQLINDNKELIDIKKDSNDIAGDLVKLINNTLVGNLPPTIGRLKTDGYIRKKGLNQLVKSIKADLALKTKNQDTEALLKIEHNRPQDNNVMNEVFEYAFAEVSKRHNMDINQLKGEMLNNSGLMEEIYKQIRMRQEEIYETARSGQGQEKIDAQAKADAMTMIPNLTDLKPTKGSVGQQQFDNLRIRPSVINCVKLKMDILEQMIKSGVDKVGANVGVITDIINKSRELARSRRKAVGEWTPEAIQSWIKIIEDDRLKSGADFSHADLYAKYSQLYGIYVENKFTGSAQGFKNFNEAFDEAVKYLKGSAEEAKYAEDAKDIDPELKANEDEEEEEEEEDELTKPVELIHKHLDPETKQLMIENNNTIILPRVINQNTTSEELKTVRDASGRIVEPECSTPYVNLSVEAQRNADQRKNVDPNYDFDKLAAERAEKESKKKGNGIDAVGDEVSDAKNEVESDIGKGDGKKSKKENSDEEAAKNANGNAGDDFGVTVVQPESRPVTPSVQQPVNPAVEEQPSAQIPANQNPAQDNFDVNVVNPPAANPPAVHREKTQEEKDREEIEKALGRGEYAHLFNSTMTNLIKIAKELDIEGKSKEAEEVHKTIRKYIK